MVDDRVLVLEGSLEEGDDANTFDKYVYGKRATGAEAWGWFPVDVLERAETTSCEE